MAITIQFTNLGEFEEQMKHLAQEMKEPFNKEFAYAIKQYSDANQLVPRLTGNLQETATPVSVQSTEWDGQWAYITYPAVYSTRLWFGVNFVFTITENINAQAKWLEPIFNDQAWISNLLKVLFKKHVIDQGERHYGRFITKG